MAVITVYKNGASTQIQDFDLEAYKKMGWSTSSSGGSSTSTSSKTTTSTPSASPTQNKEVILYKGTLSKNVPSIDVSAWVSKGWSSTKPTNTTQPSTTPTQTSPIASTSTPPAGATYISNPAELSKYTESQIWRDPNSNKIYLKAGQSAQTPVASTTPTPQQTTTPASATMPTNLNTVGLIEAYARRQAGTATPTDIANLDYATSKGWTPPSSSNSSSTTGRDTGQQVDANGDQIIAGLNTKGLKEAYARKLAGTANATDLANLSYAESKGWKPQGASASVTDPQAANDIINAEQDADIAAKTPDDTVKTRKTTEDIMEEIKKTITPDIAAPETPDYEQSLRDLRTEYGIDPLEMNLNDLNSQLQELYAQRESRIQSERDKTVATNIIAGRIGEVERQENERIAALERSISNVTNQLNTKYGIVNSLMDAKQLDYKTAAEAYDAQMQENITLFNAAQSIEDSLKTEDQRVIDNARSSAQILVNGFSNAGMTYDQLSDAQKTILAKLSLESGFGTDFYQTLLATTQEVQAEVLTSIVSDDKAYVTVVYKNGTTATVPTGMPRSSNVPAGGSGGGSTSTEDKAIAAFRKDAADLIEKLDNGEIGWGTAWDQLHIKYPDASPQLIDQTLGGGLAYVNEESGATTDTQGNAVNVNDQGYYGRGTKIATQK